MGFVLHKLVGAKNGFSSHTVISRRNKDTKFQICRKLLATEGILILILDSTNQKVDSAPTRRKLRVEMAFSKTLWLGSQVPNAAVKFSVRSDIYKRHIIDQGLKMKLMLGLRLVVENGQNWLKGRDPIIDPILSFFSVNMHANQMQWWLAAATSITLWSYQRLNDRQRRCKP